MPFKPKNKQQGDNQYIPSTFEVVCGCGVVHKIRTDEHVKIITCWEKNCNRGIKVVLGYGRNNFSIYIVENGKDRKVNPTAVWQ